MKFYIIKVIKESADFEDASVLAGLNRQPALDELPGDVFWSLEKQTGILAVPEEGDDLTPEESDAIAEESLQIAMFLDDMRGAQP